MIYVPWVVWAVIWTLAVFGTGVILAVFMRGRFGAGKADAVNDALATIAGSVGAVFLAVGIAPTSGATAGPGHNFIVVRSPFLLDYGLRLLLTAFGLQAPKVTKNLIDAFRPQPVKGKSTDQPAESRMPLAEEFDRVERQAGARHDDAAQRASVDAGKARLQRWVIEALGRLIEALNKSAAGASRLSGRLIAYTKWLIVLTVALVALAIVQVAALLWQQLFHR